MANKEYSFDDIEEFHQRIMNSLNEMAQTPLQQGATKNLLNAMNALEKIRERLNSILG